METNKVTVTRSDGTVVDDTQWTRETLNKYFEKKRPWWKFWR